MIISVPSRRPYYGRIKRCFRLPVATGHHTKKNSDNCLSSLSCRCNSCLCGYRPRLITTQLTSPRMKRGLPPIPSIIPTITPVLSYSLSLTAKHRLGRSLFLLQNRFLALVLPNLNRSGYNFAHTYCTEYTCGPT